MINQLVFCLEHIAKTLCLRQYTCLAFFYVHPLDTLENITQDTHYTCTKSVNYPLEIAYVTVYLLYIKREKNGDETSGF